MKKSYKGLFVGLSTIDLIYLVNNMLSCNTKIVSSKQLISSGGPAANAPIAFSHLGGRSKLITSFGSHPLAKIISDEVKNYNINLINLANKNSTLPTVSSIFVIASTGERTVVSANSAHINLKYPTVQGDYFNGTDIVLIDGHYMELCVKSAKIAKSKNIPVVFDGGSWKNGTEDLLPFVDYAICSNNFLPPMCKNAEQTLKFLQKNKINCAAVTNGYKPICFFNDDKYGEIEIKNIKAKDTLGAGDIFHGAFCFYLLKNNFDFISSLKKAAEIATLSCKYYGTREYMNHFVL